MHFTSVADANAYIESFATRPPDALDHLPSQERQAARLPHLRALLAQLGDPQERLRVAHVTGTSGKGSTATYIEAILRAGGVRTGLYTNPYIVAPQERVQIAGGYIDDANFVACAQRVADAVDVVAPQFPDQQPHLKAIWVALALLAFQRTAVDVAVIEVGMGGRFDETSVVHPVVSVITNIGFDHMEFLGGTLEAIAWQKAGIIKAGAPAVTSVTQPALLAILRAEADRYGSPLAALGSDFAVDAVTTTIAGTRFTYSDATGTIADLHTPLVGTHNATNAALAVRAAREIVPGISKAAIRAGVMNAWLPGRFEIVGRAPLIILDAAHNPDKIRALVATLMATVPGCRLFIIFGALGTKDATPMLAALAPLAPRLIATAPAVVGRTAFPAERTAHLAHEAGIAATAEDDPHAALAAALRMADPNDVIVVTGSLFLVSQLRPRLITPPQAS